MKAGVEVGVQEPGTEEALGAERVWNGVQTAGKVRRACVYGVWP